MTVINVLNVLMVFLRQMQVLKRMEQALTMATEQLEQTQSVYCELQTQVIYEMFKHQLKIYFDFILAFKSRRTFCYLSTLFLTVNLTISNPCSAPLACKMRCFYCLLKVRTFFQVWSVNVIVPITSTLNRWSVLHHRPFFSFSFNSWFSWNCRAQFLKGKQKEEEDNTHRTCVSTSHLHITIWKEITVTHQEFTLFGDTASKAVVKYTSFNLPISLLSDLNSYS